LEILTSVSGEITPFSTIHSREMCLFQPVWKGPKCKFIDNEILSLLNKGVIIPSQHEPGEFISPIFLRDKRGGSFRRILNFKHSMSMFNTITLRWKLLRQSHL
jgi:hypothetical protein